MMLLCQCTVGLLGTLLPSTDDVYKCLGFDEKYVAEDRWQAA